MAEKRDSAAVDITALQTALVGAVTSVFSSVKKEKKKPSTCDFSDSDDDPDDFIPKRPRTTSRLPLPLRPLPSALHKRAKSIKSIPTKKPKSFYYDRDIICLPQFMRDKCTDMVPIPRSASVRDYLGKNGLIGKIQLESSMTEEQIFSEVRSVFKQAMGSCATFGFEILQPTGGVSKSLTIPAMSSSFRWTASSIASKSAKQPIYILAVDELQIHCADADENDSDENLPSPVRAKQIIPYCLKQQDHCTDYYKKYIEIASGEEENPIAISPSPDPPQMSPLTPDQPSSCTELKTLLKSHTFCEISGEYDQCQRIVIRRKYIWEDTLAQIKKGVMFHWHLRVTFVGEPAVDAGGPCREFLRLLIREIFSSNHFFEGEDDTRIPCHNMRALQDGTFRYIGQMVALSITHDGPGPGCLATSVVQYLLYGLNGVHPRVEDISDIQMRKKVQKLMEVKSDLELSNLLDSPEFEFRYDCGMLQLGTHYSVAKKHEVTESIMKHILVVKIKAELDDLKDGLRTLNVLKLMEDNPETMKLLFIKSQNRLLSFNVFQDLFVADFSTEGSNQREMEEQVYMFWINLLQEIETNEGSINANGEDFKISLGDILAFVTGASVVPPMGFFPNPAVSFHSNSSFPDANTCSNTIRLPIQGHTYESFKYAFCFGVANSVGFGHI